LHFVKAGADLTQGEAFGDFEALLDVAGCEDKAGELEAAQRCEVCDGSLSNVEAAETRASQWGEVFDPAAVQGE
jgi:hypothetical protein